MSQPRPKALIAIGAGAVIAAAVVLVFALNKRDDDQPAPEVVSPAPTESTPTVAQPGGPSTPVVQAVPRGDTSSGASDEREVLEYEINGIKIRDHRKNGKRMELPPNIHPPGARRVSSALVYDLHAQIRKLAAECGGGVAAADRGAKPKITTQVVIEIKGGQATVTKSTASTSDVNGVSSDAVKSCMEQKAVGFVTEAKDEADLPSYSINLTVPLL